MNRLITAYVADTSACPKRQAVFYLREAMSHAQMRRRCEAYGERRDIELKRKRKRDGGILVQDKGEPHYEKDF